MAILATFLLGIGNFALHGAVLESRHRLFRSLPAFLAVFDGRISLFAEFAVLLGALLLVASGHPFWGWAYFGYTLLNGGAAWLILSQRV
jgi:hypothetical protein